VEARQGRQRSFANAPRTLDLDLLLYGDAQIDEAGLIVPHPRMHERAFVLAPLVELSPGLHIPGIGPANDRLAECAGQEMERIA
jgi:2-amino-4-hydroxy-6-hydroxymethyldihydropteridine diphosphokinase